MANPDYPNLLHNLLQGHPSGNLSQHLRYVFTQEVPNGEVIHVATANYGDQLSGPAFHSRGTSKSVARSNAAKATYEDFLRNGVPGT